MVFKLNDLFRFFTIIGTSVGFALYLDNRFDKIDLKFAKIDQKFEQVDRRFDGIDERLDKIEAKVDQTSNLLNTYLTWRFIYVNDPERKHLTPIYDPGNGTLDFVDKRK